MTDKMKAFLEEAAKDADFTERLGKADLPEADFALAKETGFELILQNTQWADPDHRYDFVNEVGHYSKKITVVDGMEGSLWILVQLGNVVNEITVKNILITEVK